MKLKTTKIFFSIKIKFGSFFLSECIRPLTVLIPSESAMLSLIPQDIANPFVTDALLQHLTVFSHVFAEGWNLPEDDEVTVLALNGAEIVVEKRENGKKFKFKLSDD